MLACPQSGDNVILSQRAESLHRSRQPAQHQTDAEIAAVANYAIAHFGGKQGQVTAKDVTDARP
jgi:mono/diheme cytochrome c family protein